jgi:hypothetical protein
LLQRRHLPHVLSFPAHRLDFARVCRKSRAVPATPDRIGITARMNVT